MKVPLKHRAISAVLGEPQADFRSFEIKTFDYAHENPLLGEIAGHVINRYLKFREESNRFGTIYDFRFGTSNPNTAILQLHQTIDSRDDEESNGRIREVIFENTVEEFLHTAFKAIDYVHKVENAGFFGKVKILLTKDK